MTSLSASINKMTRCKLTLLSVGTINDRLTHPDRHAAAPAMGAVRENISAGNIDLLLDHGGADSPGHAMTRATTRSLLVVRAAPSRGVPGAGAEEYVRPHRPAAEAPTSWTGGLLWRIYDLDARVRSRKHIRLPLTISLALFPVYCGTALRTCSLSDAVVDFLALLLDIGDVRASSASETGGRDRGRKPDEKEPSPLWNFKIAAHPSTASSPSSACTPARLSPVLRP